MTQPVHVCVDLDEPVGSFARLQGINNGSICFGGVVDLTERLSGDQPGAPVEYESRWIDDGHDFQSVQMITGSEGSRKFSGALPNGTMLTTSVAKG